MNKFAVLCALACVLGMVSFASALPPQLKEKVETLREMMKCSHANCEKENNAMKALFKEDLERCLKLCNASDKKFSTASEEDRTKLIQCFKANNCKLPLEHIRANRDTPEFKAMKACAEEKCKETMSKLKNLDPVFSE